MLGLRFAYYYGLNDAIGLLHCRLTLLTHARRLLVSLHRAGVCGVICAIVLVGALLLFVIVVIALIVFVVFVVVVVDVVIIQRLWLLLLLTLTGFILQFAQERLD